MIFGITIPAEERSLFRGLARDVLKGKPISERTLKEMRPEILWEHQPEDTEEVIGELKPDVKGWADYFQFS